MSVCKRIKERREEIGMSIAELAEALGKNRSTIYRYENGDIEKLPLDFLVPLAKALHTTPAYLMGWDVEVIDQIATMQDDANASEDSNEVNLKSFYKEFNKYQYSSEDISDIINFIRALKETSVLVRTIHTALSLTDDELEDLNNYAQFILSKRKED